MCATGGSMKGERSRQIRPPRATVDPEKEITRRVKKWLKNPGKPGPEEKACGAATRGLDLRNLGLRAFPEVLRTLPHLEAITLNDNQIDFIPDWIGELKSLKIMGVGSNRLTSIPKALCNLRELRGLYLQGNQITTLPTELLNVGLRTLSVRDNPLQGIPKSILSDADTTGEGGLLLLRYLAATKRTDATPLQELKLLLVGGEQTNTKEPETHSIAIRELTTRCNSGDVRTRAWDFGGQEILHSTHQFFLTERSLYLLVLEPRSGLAQRDAEYWLKLIEVNGGGSPVIVVLNWSKDRPWRVDEVRLRRQFPFIVDFISTDALANTGIDQLRNAIANTVEGRIPDVWLPFPRQWRQIKDAVAGMKQNFLTYAQYVDLCATNGEEDPQAQSDLAKILHALGLVLYFGNDPRLHDTRVLNPSWVTGGVYAVVRSPTVAKNGGQLTRSDMPSIVLEAEARDVIRSADYAADTHQFILDLMRAFQLCYTADDRIRAETRYLVPELLSEFEPELADMWEVAPTRLRYRYEVLPPGLLPRFTVRTHALSEGAPHWRLGVVLKHDDASALIRAELERNEIHVFVAGDRPETRRILGTIVRRELDALHEEIKNFPVEELELSGDLARWISVKALQKIGEKARGVQTLPVQPDGTARVAVSKELEKLAPQRSKTIRRPRKIRVFVSYAHEDERQLKRLDCLLGVLEQYEEIEPWTDKRLIAGEDWNFEIQRRLEEMDIFLFVASQTSLVRPYIRNQELKRARERKAKKQIDIVTIKLEPCACDEDPVVGPFQRLGAKHPSIAETNPRSRAWEQVRKDLKVLIKRVSERRATTKPLNRLH
jgi:internalin A